MYISSAPAEITFFVVSIDSAGAIRDIFVMFMVVYIYDFLDKPTTGGVWFDDVIGLLQYINVPKSD
jgi:hypothetical protein